MTKKLNTTFVGSANRESSISIYFPKQHKKAQILLFAHGFKGFKDWGHFPLIQQLFTDKGFIVVTFNFSHNGGTVVNPMDLPDLVAFSNNNYMKELEDIESLLNWMSANEEGHFSDFNLNNINLLGHSRGGGIALLAAEKFQKIKKVITWAAVADFEERLPDEEQLAQWKKAGVYFIRNGRTKQDMPMKFQFVDCLKKHKTKLNIEHAVIQLDKPLLIVHGKEDETVNYENAERIKSWAKRAQLELIQKCNHTFNGKHPWEEVTLPEATLKAIEVTTIFLTT